MNAKDIVNITNACKLLKDFCCSRKEARPVLEAVCVQGRYAYATNTHLLVRMELDCESEEKLLLRPDMSGDVAGDFPDAERIIKGSLGMKAAFFKGAINCTEWKRIFTLAGTQVTDESKGVWLVKRGSKLMLFAGNANVQSCFVLAHVTSVHNEDQVVVSCVNAGYLYNIANLMEKTACMGCEMSMPLEKYGNILIKSDDLTFVISPIRDEGFEKETCYKDVVKLRNEFLMQVDAPASDDESAPAGGDDESSTADLDFLD